VWIGGGGPGGKGKKYEKNFENKHNKTGKGKWGAGHCFLGYLSSSFYSFDNQSRENSSRGGRQCNKIGRLKLCATGGGRESRGGKINKKPKRLSTRVTTLWGGGGGTADCRG